MKKIFSTLFAFLLFASVTTPALATIHNTNEANKNVDQYHSFVAPYNNNIMGTSQVTVNNLIFHHRDGPGTGRIGHLHAGQLVTFTQAEWGNQVFFEGNRFVQVTASGGPHSGIRGWVASRFLTAPTWWHLSSFPIADY